MLLVLTIVNCHVVLVSCRSSLKHQRKGQFWALSGPGVSDAEQGALKLPPYFASQRVYSCCFHGAVYPPLAMLGLHFSVMHLPLQVSNVTQLTLSIGVLSRAKLMVKFAQALLLLAQSHRPSEPAMGPICPCEPDRLI